MILARMVQGVSTGGEYGGPLWGSGPAIRRRKPMT
jgi:hypothetical protein